MSSTLKPVLILGAGVHGATIALELVRQGIPVRLADRFDLAFGATSKSSRLIHGGLRYLEYGDFKLVRESLAARSANLEFAPQFVQPLRLFIPVSSRWSGLKQSVFGFFGWNRTTWGRHLLGKRTGRGYWPVRLGLWMYDCLTARDSRFHRSTSAKIGVPGVPRVNARRYRWLCSYADAQMLYPERLVLALLRDTQAAATQSATPFQISTYTQIECRDGNLELHDTLAQQTEQMRPACIVNATGAWGDQTLQELRIDLPPMFGGTKGSHFISWNAELKAALQGQAVYAEADDGRLVFILPFAEGTLVGTTDETFGATPEAAVATEAELEYLLLLTNQVLDLHLTRADIAVHYSGVRPLPRTADTTNAAVTREHGIAEHRIGDIPVLTLVGGKLTTWREFGREVCSRVLLRIGKTPSFNSQTRAVSGSENYREIEQQRGNYVINLAVKYAVPVSLVRCLWPLYGTFTAEILYQCREDFGRPITDTPFTTGVVRWVIDHEWVRTLSDLVERRLMLVFAPQLSRRTLADLADCLVTAGKLSRQGVSLEILRTEERLSKFYGRRLDEGLLAN